MRIGEPRFGGGDEAIGNKGSMLARKMADYPGVSGLVPPRERKRILWKFITMRDVERRGERRSFTEPVGPQYLSGFHHLGLIQSRSVRAIAQFVVPRSMPRLKRLVMSCRSIVALSAFAAGEVGFTGPPGVSRHFGRRDAAYFSSTSAGAIVGSRSRSTRTRRGRFTELVFQP